jgi:hypothetical protein
VAARSLQVFAEVSDPGSAGCLFPVLDVLAGRGHRVTVCTRPAAARLAGISPDVVVSSVCTDARFRQDLISLANGITRTKLGRVWLRQFPPVDCGACAEARSAEELAALLARAASGELCRVQRRAQQGGFPAPRGGVATRIAGLVERIANGHGTRRPK